MLAGPSDTSSSPLNMWYQSAETVEASDCIDKVRSQDANLFVNVVVGLCWQHPLTLQLILFPFLALRCFFGSYQHV